MSFRLFFLLCAAAALWAGCQCGGSPDLCAGIKCGPGSQCNSAIGVCQASAPAGGAGGSNATGGGEGGGVAGGSGGGNSSAACTPACRGFTPVCDPAPADGGAPECVTCTATEGCAGLLPYCITSVPGGLCAECRQTSDCTVQGTVCDPNLFTCVTPGGTGGGAGGGNNVQFGDGGVTAHCLPYTPTGTTCTSECNRGYECLSGQCVLRGSSGPVQVTLRFPQDEDLDLHLVEPENDGGTCEIYYANPGVNPNPPPIPLPFPIPMPFACGAVGYLDLDSNPDCKLDHVRIENIIYAPTRVPPKGTYIVRVTYYAACGSPAPQHIVPYEVEVRANGTTRYYCGSFTAGYSTGGNQGSGDTVTTFTLQ